MRTSWLTSILVAAAIACSDDSNNSSLGGSETGDGEEDSGDGDGDAEGNSGSGDGDGDGGSGDGDGDSGDGDGDSGDGDGDGDGSSGDGDGDTGDGDGDTGDGDGDGDGDGECDPNAFVGQALADDPWHEGSLCDEIWVCATQEQAQMLMNLIDVQCEGPMLGSGCPEQRCTLSFGTIVTAQDVDNACAALSVPGIDEVLCVVYGP